MSFPFNPHASVIWVDAELEGPTGIVVLRLALDTVATVTLLTPTVLPAAGYNLSLAPAVTQITTGSGVHATPVLPVQRLKALGREVFSLSILSHPLPPTTNLDGVLGLDFFR